jgi:hypothetical protein
MLSPWKVGWKLITELANEFCPQYRPVYDEGKFKALCNYGGKCYAHGHNEPCSRSEKRFRLRKILGKRFGEDIPIVLDSTTDEIICLFGSADSAGA